MRFVEAVVLQMSVSLSPSLVLHCCKGPPGDPRKLGCKQWEFFPEGSEGERAGVGQFENFSGPYVYLHHSLQKKKRSSKEKPKIDYKIMKGRNCRVVFQGGGIPGKRGPGKVPPHSTPEALFTNIRYQECFAKNFSKKLCVCFWASIK
jgi:hypothetical protein